MVATLATVNNQLSDSVLTDFETNCGHYINICNFVS